MAYVLSGEGLLLGCFEKPITVSHCLALSVFAVCATASRRTGWRRDWRDVTVLGPVVAVSQFARDMRMLPRHRDLLRLLVLLFVVRAVVLIAAHRSSLIGKKRAKINQ